MDGPRCVGRERQAVPLGALCAPPHSHLGALWWWAPNRHTYIHAETFTTPSLRRRSCQALMPACLHSKGGYNYNKLYHGIPPRLSMHTSTCMHACLPGTDNSSSSPRLPAIYRYVHVYRYFTGSSTHPTTQKTVLDYHGTRTQYSVLGTRTCTRVPAASLLFIYLPVLASIAIDLKVSVFGQSKSPYFDDAWPFFVH